MDVRDVLHALAGKGVGGLECHCILLVFTPFTGLRGRHNLHRTMTTHTTERTCHFELASAANGAMRGHAGCYAEHSSQAVGLAVC